MAIVTGAASGIGKAAAQCLADAGNTVVIADIREPEGTAAAETIGKGAVYRYLDVSDEQGWLDLIAWTKAELGGFDILVNNAATFTFGAIDSASYEDWLHTFKVNAGGPFLGCKHAVREMKDTGGVIVNVSLELDNPGRIQRSDLLHFEGDSEHTDAINSGVRAQAPSSYSLQHSRSCRDCKRLPALLLSGFARHRYSLGHR